MYLKDSAIYEHHRETYGEEFGYKDFIPMFKAEKFDPARWAELFRKAGREFVVPVAEHHDGFAMYDCRFSRWTRRRWGRSATSSASWPRRCAKRAWSSALSSHRAEHWWFMDGGRKFDSDVQDPAFADFYGPASPRRKRTTAWHNAGRHDPNGVPRRLAGAHLRTGGQVSSRSSSGSTGGSSNWPSSRTCSSFAAYYYNRGARWGRASPSTTRMTPSRRARPCFDVERGQLKPTFARAFGRPTPPSRRTPGATSADQDYKTGDDIIDDLVDIVSKNGALLLNIGPRPDGTIPDEEQELLLEIGELAGGQRRGDLRHAAVADLRRRADRSGRGQFTDNERTFTAQDIRSTTKGERLFAITLGEPHDAVVIKSLAAERIRAVRLLGYGPALAWTQDETGLAHPDPATRRGQTHSGCSKFAPRECCHISQVVTMKKLAFLLLLVPPPRGLRARTGEKRRADEGLRRRGRRRRQDGARPGRTGRDRQAGQRHGAGGRAGAGWHHPAGCSGASTGWRRRGADPGGGVTNEQASALLGQPVTLTPAEDPVSLAGAKGVSDALLTEIIWNGAPQVRERQALSRLPGRRPSSRSLIPASSSWASRSSASV